MRHRVKITVATAAFAAAVVISVSDALGATYAEQRQEQRRLDLSADDQAALERDRAGRERVEPVVARLARIRAEQAEFGRLCVILPVMTDAGLEGCRQAFRL